ncbi:hypothetical protein MRX96_013899 [Rhipicephalus microplus]
MMAVRTNVDGVETLLTPILSEDGSRIPQGDGFACSAPGSGRVSCEFEEELSDVLEKERHIIPTVLITPGRVIEKNRDSHDASRPNDRPPVSASQDAEPARPEGAAAAYSGSEEPAEMKTQLQLKKR